MKEWFPLESVQKDSNKKYMFCFHHAGGNAAVFRKWTLEDWPIRVASAELPGKGIRMNEKFIEDIDVLADEIAKAIVKKTKGEDFYLFGHSMGAVIAFKTAYLLENKYNRQPSKLIVVGRPAPPEPNPNQFGSMEDEVLIEELIKINATPKEILENKEMMSFFLPRIRSDYKLHESYVYGGEKIKTPIIAHAGKSDIGSTADIMCQWAEVTEGDFMIREFEGDHFFIHNLKEEYTKKLLQDLLA